MPVGNNLKFNHATPLIWEFDEQSICAKNAQVQLKGKRKIVRTYKFYSLDVIISVGYRVKSNRGIDNRWEIILVMCLGKGLMQRVHRQYRIRLT